MKSAPRKLKGVRKNKIDQVILEKKQQKKPKKKTGDDSSNRNRIKIEKYKLE